MQKNFEDSLKNLFNDVPEKFKELFDSQPDAEVCYGQFNLTVICFKDGHGKCHLSAEVSLDVNDFNSEGVASILVSQVGNSETLQ